MRRLYYMHDPEPRGVFPVEGGKAEAERLNRWHKAGIFATVNEFDGPRRLDNLRRIRGWAIDIDEGSKQEQRDRIEKSPLVPSVVVETKNGYHVHWHAKDATPETWQAIVVERLVPFFGADRNARDIARILRVPGYWHWKDPEHPFTIRRVHHWEVAYTERQMLDQFPADESLEDARLRAQADARQVKREVRSEGDTSGDGFWQRAIELDCAHALERLSGHWLVNGEEYSFRRVRNGNLNIVVDGKGTSCWVDADGRIGSKTMGGPSIVRWCRWLGHSYRDIANGLKEVFSELEGR